MSNDLIRSQLHDLERRLRDTPAHCVRTRERLHRAIRHKRNRLKI